jgi:hypothetical protein
MNKFNIFMFMGLLVLAQSALASPSATLQIKGRVAPGACIPTLSNNGVIDIGDYSLEQIKNGVNVVSVQSINLNIACASPTRVAYSMTDNRHSSLPALLPKGIPNSASQFGLGRNADGIPIGSWYIETSEAVIIDGSEGHNISSPDATAWYAQGNELLNNMNSGKSDYYSFSLESNLTPATATAFSTSLSVNVALSSELRTITEKTTIDGNASVDIIYL